jgi:hypothetical protein
MNCRILLLYVYLIQSEKQWGYNRACEEDLLDYLKKELSLKVVLLNSFAEYKAIRY